MDSRSRLATATRVKESKTRVAISSSWMDLPSAFPCTWHHPPLIRTIEWIPTLGRTSVHKRAYPLTTRPVYSQPLRSDPRSTTGALPENPRSSAQWSPTSINHPHRRCNLGTLCVDSNQFCARTAKLSLIGVVSIPHNKLLQIWTAYFEHLPGRIPIFLQL